MNGLKNAKRVDDHMNSMQKKDTKSIFYYKCKRKYFVQKKNYYQKNEEYNDWSDNRRGAMYK